MLHQVLIVEAWPSEEVTIFYCLHKSSWCNYEETSMEILYQFYFVLSLVIIAWDICINGIDMGMSHNPSALFLCPFKISFEYLRILISF